MKVVSFEIAKKLKEKGFREKCFLHYEVTGGIYSNSIDTYDRPNQELDYSDFLRCYNGGNSIGLIDAPTISQVLKWLREENKIYTAIYYVPVIEKVNGDNTEKSLDFYYPTIQKIGDFEPTIHTNGNDCFESYEEAALTGIEYVLDNLI